MIGFDLTDEQREFRDLAHKFAAETIRPVAPEADEKEEVPWEVLRRANQAGLISFSYPEEYGGGGVDDLLTKMLISEEIFWGCAGVGTILGGVDLGAIPLMLAGTPEQKERYLPRLCDPAHLTLGAYGLTEAGAGSDPAGMRTTARREGDRYILNGQKTFITNAGINDLYIIFATVDPSQGVNGVTAFIVEADSPGVTAGKKEKKLGIRCSQTAGVTLQDVEAPLENRLGEEGEGFRIAMRTFDLTRPHIAAGAVGVARAAYEYALQYAQERRQFGKPIASFQAVAFMLADMATQIEAARLLVWRSAWLHDQGRTNTLEASMAKVYAADMAMQVTTDAVQILGGYGYMREYPVEKYMRDAKIMQIYEGTSQIQRLVISRRLTGAR